MRKIIKSAICTVDSLRALNITDGIFGVIVQYSSCTPFQFDTDNLLSYTNQLQFNDARNSVRFEHEYDDFLNIMSDGNLLTFDCNGNVRFDTYIIGHRDEMWIGVIDRGIYGPVVYTDYQKKSIYYYDGRGRALITAFGVKQHHILDDKYRYNTYDWISFSVNAKHNTITFWKNQNIVSQVSGLFGSEYYVYNGIVDRKNDGFYVEKVFVK